MVEISYSTGQQDQVNQLRSYVEDYCKANNIDPALYTNYLDNKKTLDPTIINDPAFQAYWKMTYLSLMEIINPTLTQSVYSEVGEVDFDKVYAKAGNDLNDLLNKIVADDPALINFVALQQGDPDPNSGLLQKIFSAGKNAAEPGHYVDEEARRLGQELGLGGAYEWLISHEEGIISTEQFLMNGLAEMDQKMAEITEGIRSGRLTAEEGKADLETMSQNRGIYLTLIQNLESSLNKMLEMFSNLKKEQQEALRVIANNLSAK